MDEGIPGEMDVLRALAHPVRWGILQRLAAEPGICACDFTEFFDVSQPTISAHLKVLREAGLVTSKRIGTTICYSIAPSQLASLGARLAQMAATADETPPHSHPARRRRGRRRPAGANRASGLEDSSRLVAVAARSAHASRRAVSAHSATRARMCSGMSRPRAAMIRSNICASP